MVSIRKIERGGGELIGGRDIATQSSTPPISARQGAPVCTHVPRPLVKRVGIEGVDVFAGEEAEGPRDALGEDYEVPLDIREKALHLIKVEILPA